MSRANGKWNILEVDVDRLLGEQHSKELRQESAEARAERIIGEALSMEAGK